MKSRKEEMCAMDDMNKIYNVMLGDVSTQEKNRSEDFTHKSIVCF
jgi:hypothetical protein